MKLSHMTRMTLCVSMLCISSYLVIPLPFTPIVLSIHTVAVNLVGLILRPKYAACTLLIYLLMGLVGLPVFSAGTSGAGKLLGPTGGFYFGFLFAAAAVSFVMRGKSSFLRGCISTICVGLPIQHAFAIASMCIHNGFDVQAAAASVSMPFIIGDIVKCIIASAVSTPLNKALHRIT